jgi:predicted phosphodiesterase
MSPPRVSPEQAAEAARVLKETGGNKAEAARQIGIARSTFDNRLLASTRKSPEPRAVPRFGDDEGAPHPLSEGPVIKVVALGDPHDKPGRCKKRFKWLGRFAAEMRPDAVVSIGDWASLDSLSTHEQPGSANDAERPAYHEELESLEESIHLFRKGWPMTAAPTFITLGNHEHRAYRAANRQPKQCGDLPTRLEQVFAQYRIATKPFGEFLSIGGVDFVHCPINVMGREMGGMHVERTIGNNALRSLVFGHTHRSNVVNVTKVGQQRKITIVNLGTAMPHGTVEKYTGLAMSGWSYGAFVLRIQAGQILSAKQFDMIELEEVYGD